MALDHLGAVVDAVVAGPPKRLNAHFTVLRTALICGTRVCWLLEPASSNVRQLRAIRYRYENLHFSGPAPPPTDSNCPSEVRNYT